MHAAMNRATDLTGPSKRPARITVGDAATVPDIEDTAHPSIEGSGASAEPIGKLEGHQQYAPQLRPSASRLDPCPGQGQGQSHSVCSAAWSYVSRPCIDGRWLKLSTSVRTPLAMI
jgi:hypothetical protein